ncbi:DinB family protein [Mucilaginibacter myungsuensis]|uniref:DinB family protein n=1 Tax=Mucilaginibacter myungsuensis TaxID=649104 RepID=A0A929L1H3_9SPHI|nr:DinB family protein [Mucilaginibacter myungsuensis]MBE9663878.1 DinB family protein [Mucilaginibacter myungsuensis]MDN3598406.1 DinB family protein [Mucilaginibacter myungsuensis]
MKLLAFLKKNLIEEAAETRKMLATVKDEDFAWQPHPKSMTIARLVSHLADIGGWIHMTLTTNELDFAQGFTERPVANVADALELFDANVAKSLVELEKATEEFLDIPWTMRNGEMIYFTDSKAGVIHMSMGQMIHHRAQLGVFLRLLDVAIPGPYGPSADEMALFGLEETEA